MSQPVKCGLAATTYGEQPSWAYAEQNKPKHTQHYQNNIGTNRTGEWSKTEAPALKPTFKTSTTSSYTSASPKYGGPVGGNSSSSSSYSSSSSSSSSSAPKYGGPVGNSSSSYSSSTPKYGGPVGNSSSSAPKYGGPTKSSSSSSPSSSSTSRPSVSNVTSGSAFHSSNSQSTFQRDTDTTGNNDVVKCGLSKTTYEKQPAWAFAEKDKNTQGRYQVGKNTQNKALW